MEKPIKVRVNNWRKGKPTRISLIWIFDNEVLCRIRNEDALKLASEILQLQKGKPKEKAK